MTSALPKKALEALAARPNGKPAGGHAGLWFDKYFDKFDPGSDWKLENAKTSGPQWIKSFTGKCGDADALKQYACRQGMLIDALGGKTGRFATDWNFVTGLGNAHPTENGFSWHATLGVPYLPGAAVKGLLRAWVEQWAADEAAIESMPRWCGDPAQMGTLAFFDAVPVEQPLLGPDVMTPHYADWYAKGGNQEGERIDWSTVPADWHDPNPIQFLVVRKARFQFAIAPAQGGSAADVADAFTQLGEALATLGAGAKTAAGYGRMTRTP